MLVPCARVRPRWVERERAVAAIRRTLFDSATGDASPGRAALPVSSRTFFSRSDCTANAFERIRTAGRFYGRGGILADTLPFRLGPSRSRWNSYSKHRSRVPRMSDCRTLEEAIEATYDHLDILSPRDVAAFWAVVPKFLQIRDRAGSANRGRHGNGRNMWQQFEKILCHTIEGICAYDPRDMSTTTLAFAKIVKNVGVEGKNVPNDSPRRILHDLMVGTDSENKHFIFQEVTLASMPILEEFDPRSLSNFIYAFGLAGHNHEFEDGDTFFDMLALAAIPNLKKFKSQELSNMLLAYAYVGVSNSELFKRTADVIERGTLERFTEQAIANIVWAYAKVNERQPTLFKKVADHIMEPGNLGGFDPQNLSNIVWAFATLNEPHPKLFEKVANHIMALNDLGTFIPQEFSNVVWAYATAKESNPLLFQRVAEHIMTLENLGNFAPQALSNIVWAYAKVNEPYPELSKRVAEHIMGLDDLGGFIPQNLSNIAWAYATAKEYQPTLFQKLAEAAIQRKAEFNSQEVANFLWANASNGLMDENLFQTLAPMAEARLHECNAQNLANIAWAFAVANVPASSLFDENFVKACNDKELDFRTEGLRQLHQWQIWQEELKSHITLHPPLSERCLKAFVSQLPNPSALQDDVVSELKAMGLQPEEEVLTKRGYRLDAVVRVGGNKIGIEVDGPSHFLGRTPSGSTILKRRQVANVEGLPILSVPYWEWNNLKRDSNKKQKYLGSLLGLSQS